MGTDAIAFLPWLRYLPIKSLKEGLEKIVRGNELRDPILKKKVDYHRNTMIPGTVRDLTDAILIEADNALKEDKRNMVYLTDDHIHMVILDIFGAGAETTTTTLRWALIYLCYHPEVQDRIYEELTEVIGNDRLPTLQDRGQLHFLEATIHEVLRKSSIALLGPPHKATCNTTLQGFRIPKDTLVILNHWAMHYDERYWNAPHEFKPERWLDDNKCFTPVQRSYLPFSAGRRGCLGESMAKTELFLILSQLMYRYKVIQAPNKPLPPLEGTFGLVHSPVDFDIVLDHRKNS